MAQQIYQASHYPQVPGTRLETVANVKGPASYTVITPGNPATGGTLVSAKDLGLVSISDVFCMTTDDGQYTGTAVFAGQPSLTVPRSFSSFLIRWVVGSTGAEVAGAVDLSARTLRVHVGGTF